MTRKNPPIDTAPGFRIHEFQTPGGRTRYRALADDGSQRAGPSRKSANAARADTWTMRKGKRAK